jgi:hypothetical protein
MPGPVVPAPVGDPARPVTWCNGDGRHSLLPCGARSACPMCCHRCNHDMHVCIGCGEEGEHHCHWCHTHG